MTKQEVRRRLFAGETLDSMFVWSSGQECDIFKADAFKPGDEVIYIPDLYLNEIPTDKDMSCDPEGIFEVLGCHYTGDDFIELCKIRFGDGEQAIEKAEELFQYVDWQHPSSALDGGEIDDEEE